MIEAAMVTKGEMRGPYFIGKNEAYELDTVPSRMFKSNFKGHDRGLVTVHEILEIIKKEKFTNVE